MYTKPLTRQSVTTLDTSNDLGTIRKVLIAAAINARFCAKLLSTPEETVRNGFGGEQFFITETTLKILGTIRASTLTDFIQQLDDGLSHRLLNTGNT